MLNPIRIKLVDLASAAKYNIEMSQLYDVGGIWAFIESLRQWWRERPRRKPCAACGTLMWIHGTGPWCPSFCSESCAHYGWQSPRAGENDIPF